MHKRHLFAAMLFITIVSSTINASVDIGSGLSSASEKALVKDIDLLKLCLEKGMKPSNALLDYALSDGNLPAIELLVSFGANINNHHLYKALQLVKSQSNIVLYQKYMRIIQYLLAHGADPLKKETYWSSSPFGLALEIGNQQVIDIFKEYINNNV